MKKLNVVIVNAGFVNFVEKYLEGKNVVVVSTTNAVVSAHNAKQWVEALSKDTRKIDKMYLVNVLPSVLEYYDFGDVQYREVRTLEKGIKFTAVADNIDFAKMIREYDNICKDTRIVKIGGNGKIVFNQKLDINIKLHNIHTEVANFHTEMSVKVGLSVIRQLWKQQMPYKLEYSGVKTNVGETIVEREIFNPNAELVKVYDPNDRLTVWLQNSARAYKLKDYIKNDKIIDVRYKAPKVHISADGKPRGLQIIEQPIYKGSPLLRRSYVMGFNNLARFDMNQRKFVLQPNTRLTYYTRTNWVQRKNDMDDNESLPFYFGKELKSIKMLVVNAVETLLQINYDRYKDYKLSAQDIYKCFHLLDEVEYVNGKMTYVTHRPAIESIINYEYDWYKHDSVISAYRIVKEYIKQEDLKVKLPGKLVFNLEPETERAFEDTTEDYEDLVEDEVYDAYFNYKEKNISIDVSNLSRLEKALDTVWSDVCGKITVRFNEEDMPE